MTPRVTDHFKRAEAGFKPIFALETALKNSPLEAGLLHLVKLRASQINGCAFCIHMHTAEALKDGETRYVCICCQHSARAPSIRLGSALPWLGLKR